MPSVTDKFVSVRVPPLSPRRLLQAVGGGGDDFSNIAELELNFTLVAANVAPPTGGVKHLLILSGHGKFSPEAVTGNGVYQHIDVATKTPKKF